jgi:hypothetical protein
MRAADGNALEMSRFQAKAEEGSVGWVWLWQRAPARLFPRWTRARAACPRRPGVALSVLRKDMKLGHRDAGHLLGLSHQRIHQIEQAASAAERRRGKAKT